MHKIKNHKLKISALLGDGGFGNSKMMIQFRNPYYDAQCSHIAIITPREHCASYKHTEMKTVCFFLKFHGVFQILWASVLTVQYWVVTTRAYASGDNRSHTHVLFWKIELEYMESNVPAMVHEWLKCWALNQSRDVMNCLRSWFLRFAAGKLIRVRCRTSMMHCAGWRWCISWN